MLSRVCVRARAGGVAARRISYVAPVRDISFVLYDVLKADETYKKRGLSVDRELVDGLISECARFSETVLAPLNVIGDREGREKLAVPFFRRRAHCIPGAKHDPATNTVTTPTGFKASAAFLLGAFLAAFFRRTRMRSMRRRDGRACRCRSSGAARGCRCRWGWSRPK